MFCFRSIISKQVGQRKFEVREKRAATQNHNNTHNLSTLLCKRKRVWQQYFAPDSELVDPKLRAMFGRLFCASAVAARLRAVRPLSSLRSQSASLKDSFQHHAYQSKPFKAYCSTLQGKNTLVVPAAAASFVLTRSFSKWQHRLEENNRNTTLFPLKTQTLLSPSFYYTTNGLSKGLRFYHNGFRPPHRQNPVVSALVSGAVIVTTVGILAFSGTLIITFGGLALLAGGGFALVRSLQRLFSKDRPDTYFSYGSADDPLRPPKPGTGDSFMGKVRSFVKHNVRFNEHRSQLAMSAYDTAAKVVTSSDRLFNILGARIKCETAHSVQIQRHNQRLPDGQEELLESGEIAFPVSGSKARGRVKLRYRSPVNQSGSSSVLLTRMHLLLDNGAIIDLMTLPSQTRASTSSSTVYDATYTVKSEQKSSKGR